MINGERSELRPVEVVGVRGSLLPPALTPLEPEGPPAKGRGLLFGFIGACLVGALLIVGFRGARPESPAAAPSSEPAVNLVTRALAEQSKALLAGDLGGFLGPVASHLRSEFVLRYASLRELGVAAWTAKPDGAPQDLGGYHWKVKVAISYCLGAADCVPVQLLLPSTWLVVEGKALIAEFQQTVLPWEMTPLRAKAGQRVIVAAPLEFEGRIAPVLAAAERAAEVADRFARWNAPPKRYVVFIAGGHEWQQWWNGESDEEVDGYSEGSYGVAIKADLADEQLPGLLAHEFTHVVSLGDDYGDANTWWLTEGLAEYAAERGGWPRGRVPAVREYVKDGWDGSLTLGAMPKDVPAEEWQARYGIALLAVQCLAKRFGEDRMLDFFAAVVRGRSTPEAASPKAFGTDWAAVAAGCVTQVRNARG
ncbi:hypothetical protein ACQP00_24525 [Dactylosporangium sp. CS-047395]|uniref:hypothetical protein n=1 Tax=Dactylosporangium sp. CS-047395 TaxID=3239936 RepID=UPI003D9134F4